ncbi:MAG: flagellar hook-basal body protein [Armatimonadota bacterium]|nr:flagellar hook-basal body protein [bacterium]
MIRAFYTASSGLVAQSLKQDVIANNIANAQTPGFKRQKLVAASFAQELENQMSGTALSTKPPYPNSSVAPVTVQVEESLDPTQGPIKQTGNQLDFAIDGPGAFEVQSGSGTTYTRAGNFRLDADGELATADGEKVLGDSGPIRIPEGTWEVAADGTITSNGSAVGKIKIVGARDDGSTSLLQGSIEGANVNIVREMVDMITNVRAFEANQKVISSVDGTLDKLINSAGNV